MASYGYSTMAPANVIYVHSLNHVIRGHETTWWNLSKDPNHTEQFTWELKTVNLAITALVNLSVQLNRLSSEMTFSAVVLSQPNSAG